MVNHKIKNLILLTVASLSAFLLYIQDIHPAFENIFYSILTVTISYLILKVIAEIIISNQIKKSITRYTLRKIFSLILAFISIAIIVNIWTFDSQTLLVIYGVFTAGIALALVDFFKNILGAINIIITNIYQVGDRVEIDDKFGDIMDIGIQYTVLLEIKEWVQGDQSTGRLVYIPNHKVFTSQINNYTKDHNFIWDEINLPISYSSDIPYAIKYLKKIITENTKKQTLQASKEISKLSEKYYISKNNLNPSIYTVPNSNWIDFNIRYITDIRNRRNTQNQLTQILLAKIQNSKKIKFGTQVVKVIK